MCIRDSHYYTKATPAYYEHINEDSRISYYTEDFGYNAFNVYWHLQHPFWFDSKEYGHENYHHNVGERFLYRMKQILARYNLERLANHLQPARPIYYNYPLSVSTLCICGCDINNYYRIRLRSAKPMNINIRDNSLGQ